jgi:hypothetical protein
MLRLARTQHGVVTRRQAIERGLTKSMIETHVRRGRLRRIHPGVFCVGGAPATFEQRAVAAVAWAGAGSVASHATAAHLWRFLDEAPEELDLWTCRRRTRPPSGVCAHFTTALARRDCGKLRNVPVTSPARTLIDLAAVLPGHELEAALSQAIVDRRVTAGVLRARVAEMSRRGLQGPNALRKLLVQSEDRCRSSSPLERRVAAVPAGGTLPPFRREHPAYVEGGVYYLDFAFPHFRVAVEADGRRWHPDPAAFQRDRDRHNDLTAAGWKVLRVTEQQVRSDPAGVRDRVRELIVRG